jgi:hypothetical protein
VTALGQLFIVISVLAVGVVYGTDVFCAIALRPALALVDDRTLVSTMGHLHEFADRRMRVPGIVGLLTAGAGTVIRRDCWTCACDDPRCRRGDRIGDLARHLCAH